MKILDSKAIIKMREQQLRPYKDIAEGMETQFSQHMIQEMKKTIPREEELSSSQEYYESLMDFERAKSMSQSDSGIGLKKVILEQIVPDHLKNKLRPMIKEAYPQRAITMNVKGVDE